MYGQVPAALVAGQDPLPGCLLAVSSCGQLLGSLLLGTNPMMGPTVLTSCEPGHLPEAPPPNTMLGLELQHMNLGTQNSVHSSGTREKGELPGLDQWEPRACHAHREL